MTSVVNWHYTYKQNKLKYLGFAGNAAFNILIENRQNIRVRLMIRDENGTSGLCSPMWLWRRTRRRWWHVLRPQGQHCSPAFDSTDWSTRRNTQTTGRSTPLKTYRRAETVTVSSPCGKTLICRVNISDKNKRNNGMKCFSSIYLLK